VVVGQGSAPGRSQRAKGGYERAFAIPNMCTQCQGITLGLGPWWLSGLRESFVLFFFLHFASVTYDQWCRNSLSFTCLSVILLCSNIDMSGEPIIKFADEDVCREAIKEVRNDKSEVDWYALKDIIYFYNKTAMQLIQPGPFISTFCSVEISTLLLRCLFISLNIINKHKSINI